MTDMLVLQRLLARDRMIVALALGLMALLAWVWLAHMATMQPSPDAMATTMVAPWSAAYLAITFVMWSLMMVAMMLPSAAPMILLYARFVRGTKRADALTSTWVFVAAYLAVWTLFAAAASALQALLVATGAITDMALAIGDWRTAGALVMLVGLYQLSPVKRNCLAQCRSPLSFLMRLWRPGVAGALRMGLAHGVYCLGCCWMLMLLLFVGGVMNIVWIAGLTALVLLEKLLPAAASADRIVGATLLVSGGLLLGTA